MLFNITNIESLAYWKDLSFNELYTNISIKYCQ